VETNLGGNYFSGNYFFWWKLFFSGKVWSMKSKKGTTSNLKDLQIQCYKGTSIFTSWLCLCLALFILLLFSHGYTLGNVLGEVTRTKDGCSKNLTRMRNVPPKCNKQVTSNQQTRSFLTSINKSSKTTVALGTAMTILEIGISFPTLVDRRSRHYMTVFP
jgi:hypothetical protein